MYDIRRENYRKIQNYRGQNYRSGCRDNYRDDYRDKITIETTIETITMEDIGEGLEKDNIQVMLEGMIEEAVAVDLD